MLAEDLDKLKDLFRNYSPQEVAGALAQAAMETASDMSDDGFSDKSKELVVFASSLEDLISGRPYLV